jgi:hypothetical protein
MSNSKLIIVAMFALALGWSIWFWTVMSPGEWAQWSGQTFNNADATATIPPPIDDGQAQSLATVATAGETITRWIPVCGNEVCPAFLSEGTPFALLNYCSNQ